MQAKHKNMQMENQNYSPQPKILEIMKETKLPKNINVAKFDQVSK